jgi:hypothetical protein
MKPKPTIIMILGALLWVGNLTRASENAGVMERFSFESTSAGVNPAKGWEFKSAFLGGDYTYEGSLCLKLPVDPDDEKITVEAKHELYQNRLKPGDEVELSLYALSTAKLSPLSKPYARIIILDLQAKPIKTQVEARIALPLLPTTEWQKLSTKFTVPAEFTAESRVRLQVVAWIEKKPDTAGAIYVDDIEISIYPAAAK